MTITVATRADVRASQLRRFVSISIDIVNSMPAMPGNLGVRFTDDGLAWFTLTAWRDQAALDRFVRSERHRRAMQATEQLTHGTAFARIDTDTPFREIEWQHVKDRLASSSAPGVEDMDLADLSRPIVALGDPRTHSPGERHRT
jgi:quinol monooxygenase YgiN